MSSSGNWGYVKNNLAQLRRKIALKQQQAHSHSTPRILNAAAGRRKRLSLVELRNKEMVMIRLVAVALILLASGLLYYFNA